MLVSANSQKSAFESAALRRGYHEMCVTRQQISADMHQVPKNTQKCRFLHVPPPIFAKLTMMKPGKDPSIILLRNGDHEPPVKILPNNGPGIVTPERHIQPSCMERNPGSHVNEILHHRAQAAALRLLPMKRPVLQIAIVLPETLLSAETQQIVGHQGQDHDAGIGGKMLLIYFFASKSLIQLIFNSLVVIKRHNAHIRTH